jgi:hypothetical protein
VKNQFLKKVGVLLFSEAEILKGKTLSPLRQATGLSSSGGRTISVFPTLK